MSVRELLLDESSAGQPILALASLFDTKFSIDWIQELSQLKATVVLKSLETACLDGLMEKRDIGVFYFHNSEAKDRFKASISQMQREVLHKKIADLVFHEATDNEQGIIAAAAQLIHVDNDLRGCQILVDAGDRFRHRGMAEKALACYSKAIEDLNDKKKVQKGGVLFVKAVVGYAKNRLRIGQPDMTIPLLEQALTCAEKYHHLPFQATVLFHLASAESFRMAYVCAQKYFSRGRKIAAQIDDPMVREAEETFSVVHYCYSGRFKDAIETYESIEPVFSRKNPEFRLSYRVGLILGFCYASIGQISQGLGLVNQLRDDALALEDHDAVARTSIYIAWILIMKNDLESAVSLVRNALKTKNKLDVYTQSLAALLKACIYFEKKEFKKSHAYLKEALKSRNKYSFIHRGYLFEFCLAMKRGTFPLVEGLLLEEEIKMSHHIGNVFHQGVAYRYQAIWQQDQNKPHGEVFKNLNQSLKLLEQSGAQFEIARTKEALGRYFMEQGDTSQAKQCVAAAAKIFKKYGNRCVAEDLTPLLKGVQTIDGLFVDEILNFGPELVEIQDIKQVAQRILSTVIKITDAERGGIFLYNGNMENTESNELTLLAGKNLAGEEMEKANFKKSIELIIESAETGQVRLDNCEVVKDDPLTGDIIKSRICVPLLRGGHTMGVLYHDNRLFQSTFQKKDLKVLSYFSSLAAIALDNARAYDRIFSLNQRLSEEKNYLVEQQLEHIDFEDFIAVSPAIKKVLLLVERVANTDATALILGDTGVGKEMVARAIHQHSHRRDKPFIRVNCNAFSESLIASELFGHEKDAFTGAGKRRIGRFELADTGTLFLDEIGEISMDIQVRLLRVLQTRKFERVGDSQSISSDFRLIAATNCNLEKAVAEGRFRQDLFYRLNVFPIYVPPLRERVEGLGPLATYFLNKYADKMDKFLSGIPDSEMDKLLSYHWPGNVRELENVIERGVILNAGGPFAVPELGTECMELTSGGQLTLEDMERRFILTTIKKVEWKIHGSGGAAELLGMNHSTLYSKMKRLGIKKPDRKKN